MNVTSTLPFSAALLAGGKSSRMGRDKADLVIAGQFLWRRQLACLRGAQPEQLFISGRIDGPYAEAGLPIVVDAIPGLGPLAGLAAALRAAQYPYLLVLAIDLPAMTSDFLRQFIESALRSGKGLVPLAAERFEPLAAVYPRACLPIVESCLANPDRSLQRFVREVVARGFVEARQLQSAELPLFQNLNTPADL